jgi:hypothetical protein
MGVATVMMQLRLLVATTAFLAWADGASAGWNNVFQLTCGDCRPRTSFRLSQACCEPQPERRVEYVQRCYYQPVTEYRRESYRVPVKENVRTSYWEPVTSYTYSSYYDPCSGSCQELATPRTSYRLRERCDSVTRWVEKTRVVPVTSYKQVTMYQPVVTYYYPPSPSPSSSSFFTAPPPPTIQDLRSPPAIMPQGGSSPTPETIKPPDLPTTPGEGQSFPRTMPPATKPMAKNVHMASRSARVRGEVVGVDELTPKDGSKIVFVNANKHDDRRYVTANAFGEFDTTLPAGDWYLYVGQPNGQAVRYKKITVKDEERRDFKLVSR